MILECRCGARHATSEKSRRIECECGAVYAVAVTELRPPKPA